MSKSTLTQSSKPKTRHNLLSKQKKTSIANNRGFLNLHKTKFLKLMVWS